MSTTSLALKPRPTFAIPGALIAFAAILWVGGMAWRGWIVGIAGSICSAHGHGLMSAHCPLCYAAEALAAAALLMAAVDLRRSAAQR